jgi:hypothetical protein
LKEGDFPTVTINIHFNAHNTTENMKSAAELDLARYFKKIFIESTLLCVVRTASQLLSAERVQGSKATAWQAAAAIDRESRPGKNLGTAKRIGGLAVHAQNRLAWLKSIHDPGTSQEELVGP